MLKVNGKEVLASTSFVMEPHQEITFSPHPAGNLSYRFTTVDTTPTGAETDGGLFIDNNVAHLTVPFIAIGQSFFLSMPVGSTAHGTAIARIAGYGVGKQFMVVHFDVYFEPNAAK